MRMGSSLLSMVRCMIMNIEVQMITKKRESNNPKWRFLSQMAHVLMVRIPGNKIDTCY